MWRIFIALAILAAGIALALPSGGGIQLPLVRGVRAAVAHDVAIRGRGVVSQFYYRRTGVRFWPLGFDYAQLTPQVDAFGQRIVYHGMFNVGSYRPAVVQEALGAMAKDGYNTVRVFLDPRCASGCLGAGGVLSQRYLENVTDFLRRAARQGLEVVLTTDFVPDRTVYTKVIADAAQWPFEGENADFLTAAGVSANAAFWHNLVADLVRLGAPVQTILAYELRNEVAFDLTAARLQGRTGSVVTANGRRYDPGNPASRQRMLDEGLVYWTDRVREAIREVDPSALIAIGFPIVPSPPGSQPLALAKAVIHHSTADLVDVHLYLGTSLDAPAYARELGAKTDPKPLLLGEYGAFQDGYPTARAAAKALVSWRQLTCTLGFDGWLLWSWDTTGQYEPWTASAGNGTIEHALIPTARVDPCR
jgi:hypothetical protein